MSNTKTLTAEEVDQLRKLQEQYSELAIKLGQLELEKIIVRNQLDRLDSLSTSYGLEYRELLNKESSILKELEVKYGAITVNLETGAIS